MAKRKPLSSFARRLFHTRKIIVVSDHSVEYFPLSRALQGAVGLSLLGFVAWASYSTGSFMAAQSQIQEKDRAIAKVNLANRKINSEFSLLKQDLVRMKEEEGELSEYAQFVIKQYSGDGLAGLSDFGKKITENNHGMVFERIGFLEQRIDELKHENDEFVDAIRQIAGGKIDELEKAIKLTGLSKDALKNRYVADLEEGGKDVVNDGSGPKGGPFVPYSASELFDGEKKKAAKDLEQLMQLYSILDVMPLSKPIHTDRISSGFGRRVDPFTRRLAAHLGIDFSGPVGAKAYSTAEGVVSFSGKRGAYGNLVEVQHGLGLATRYGHLSRIMVKEGETVQKGQLLGIQGSTGRSTGNHLHYEVRYNDRALNPINFLKAGQYVSKDQ